MQKTRIGLRGLCEARDGRVCPSDASRNREIGISYLETKKRDDILNRFRKPLSYSEGMWIQVHLTMCLPGALQEGVLEEFQLDEKKWAVGLKCTTRWEDLILNNVLT